MKVCIVKTSALGDIVQAFPVLNYLHERYPDVVIDWVVESAYQELVVAHPLVRNVWAVDTKRWRKRPLSTQTRRQVRAFRRAAQAEPYDVVFDLQGNLKSGLLLSQIHAKCKVGFAWASVPEWPNLLFTNERWNPPPKQSMRADYISLLQKHFGDNQPFQAQSVALSISEEQASIIAAVTSERTILVCPGSAWRNKQLPVETLAHFLRHVRQVMDGKLLLAWGAEDERAMAVALHNTFPDHSELLNRCPLPMLQNVMRRVQLVVAMDSLPLHLAGTAGTASFALFGPSSAQKYNPAGAQHGAFQGTCPYGRTFEKRCPVLRSCQTGACLRSQHVDALTRAFDAWRSTKGVLALPPEQSGALSRVFPA